MSPGRILVLVVVCAMSALATDVGAGAPGKVSSKASSQVTHGTTASRVARTARAEPVMDPLVEAGFPTRQATGYRRGRRLPLHVVTIGWAEVEVGTARAFLRMREAAALEGVELEIRNGFREPEHQAWLYQAYRAGYGNPAARPGFSNHQDGRALDLYVRDPAIFGWLETHGGRFGFRRTVRREPWHWEYDRRLERRELAREARAKAREARASRAKRPRAR